MNDDILQERLATDVDGTFEALVRAHEDRLYSIALRLLGNASDAEEMTQDALVRAYRALTSYPPDRILALRLRGWLATIVIRRCRSFAVRRRPPTFAIEPDHPAIPAAPASETPHLHLVGRETTRRWARLLAEMPERYRIAVVLRHVDGLTYSEMSDVLGRPEGTVKAQVHRGLSMLRAAHEAAEREESIA